MPGWLSEFEGANFAKVIAWARAPNAAYWKYRGIYRGVLDL